MAKEKEIEIRISSPMPFIDDEEDEEEIEEIEEEITKDHKRLHYNVKITKNYQNKTRNIEITNELQDIDASNDIDIITNRSLSPMAPLADDNDQLISEIHVKDTKLVHKQIIKQEDGGAKGGFEMVIQDQKQRENAPVENKGMQLIIKGSKSVISIQSFDNQSSITINTEESSKREDEFEFLNAEVSKIFKKPERHEIENAIKKVKSEKPKLLCKSFKNGDKKLKQKKGTWKILSKSLVSLRGGKQGKQERRGSDERYPKMVLLTDFKKEKEPLSSPDHYPKMVMLDKKKSKRAKPKPESPQKARLTEHRSKSLSYIPLKRKDSFRSRIQSLNEISIEQHVIDIEKQNLEKEKTYLKDEKNVLQEEKKEIEKEKSELKKEKKYLSQEKHILDEKKHQLLEEKSILEDRLPDDRVLEMTIMGEEKMCLEIEKQLLSEEKHMIEEEKDLLKKEKNVIEKEKSLLGEEKNVLEEEKNLLQKEKHVLEKQKTFLEDQKFTDDERTGESEAEEEESIELSSESTAKASRPKTKSEKVLNEIEDIFEDTLKLYPDIKYLGKPKYFDGEKPKMYRNSEGSSRNDPEENPESARHHQCPPNHSPQPPYYDHYTSVPPQYCHDPYYYPTPLSYPSVYVPVYNTPRPFFRSTPNCRQCQPYCCNSRTRSHQTHSQKNSTTQTTATKIADSQMQTLDFPPKPKSSSSSFHGEFNQEKDRKLEKDGKMNEEDVHLPNLPFGLLSSFFPRMVIMKTVHNNSDENTEDESKAKIIEIPKESPQSPIKREITRSDIRGKEDEPNKKKERIIPEVPEAITTGKIDTLKIPTPDLTIKAVNVQKIRGDLNVDNEITESDETETEESGINTGCTSDDIYMKSNDENCLSVKEILNKDVDEGKKKKWEENSDESMSIENLHFGDGEIFDDESVRPSNVWEKELESDPKHMKEYENNRKQTKKSLTETDKTKNLPLTKIGYKIYDKLTKLSLERENEIIEEAEVDRCGHDGNGIKKSPYNITFELNNRIIQVTMPEDNLNFEILNSGTKQMKIGVTTGNEEREGVNVNWKQRNAPAIGETGDVVIASDDKMVVRKSELWHPENRRKIVDNKLSDDVKIVFHGKDERYGDSINVQKDPQEISLSLTSGKEIELSIQMDNKVNPRKFEQIKRTSEVKVGTDDFDLAGGDSCTTSGTNYKNLSPRTGQLLKNLQEKLESAESRKRASQLENNQRKMAMEQQNKKSSEVLLPGIFLVRQISPRQKLKANNEIKFGAKTESRSPEGRLREYYCEECLATMRMFEDDNLSVKNIVDKFETIIQLGTC